MDNDKTAPPNKLFVRSIHDDDELIEHAKKFSNAMLLDGVGRTLKNHYSVVCSTIFCRNLLESLGRARHDFVQNVRSLDEFAVLDIKVGSTVSIVNAQLQGDTVELWGFLTPKRITKITRDPSDESIRQFEFNGDPSDVWPREDNAEFDGQFIMYSAFFGSRKSALNALTMLLVQTPVELNIRNHLTENKGREMTTKTTEATNHLGDREYQTWGAWRKACLAKGADRIDPRDEDGVAYAWKGDKQIGDWGMESEYGSVYAGLNEGIVNEDHFSDDEVTSIKTCSDESVREMYRQYTQAEALGDMDRADKLANNIRKRCDLLNVFGEGCVTESITPVMENHIYGLSESLDSELLSKLIRVVQSAVTPDQLRTAEKYAQRAYDQITKSASSDQGHRLDLLDKITSAISDKEKEIGYAAESESFSMWESRMKKAGATIFETNEQDVSVSAKKVVGKKEFTVGEWDLAAKTEAFDNINETRFVSSGSKVDEELWTESVLAEGATSIKEVNGVKVAYLGESRIGRFAKVTEKKTVKKFEELLKESMSVNLSMDSTGNKTLTVTADGDDANSLAELLQLGGVRPTSQCGCGEVEVDEDLANSPNPRTADADTQLNKMAGGINRPKGQYKKEYPGDNPRAVKEVELEESLISEFKKFEAVGESNWFTDREIADVVGDEWIEDMDAGDWLFHHPNKTKRLAQQWLDNRGIYVTVIDSRESMDDSGGMEWLIRGDLSAAEVNEWFSFDEPQKKKRSGHADGHDELARRAAAKTRVDREYKDKDKYGDAYKIRGPKGKLPESVGASNPGTHLVLVTVSDPDATAVSKRNETIMKKVRVTATSINEAVTKAKAFYKKRGYKVHDSEYLVAESIISPKRTRYE